MSDDDGEKLEVRNRWCVMTKKRMMMEKVRRAALESDSEDECVDG